MKKLDYFLIIAISLIGLILSVAGFFGAYYLLESNPLTDENLYEIADGTIQWVINENSTRTFYDFVTADGSYYEDSVPICVGGFYEGKKVKVRYLPDNPEKNCIDNFMFYGIWSMFIGIFTAIIFIFTVGIIIIGVLVHIKHHKYNKTLK